MKKFVFILCAAVALFSMSQLAVAETVTFLSTQPYATGNGGEFSMSADGPVLQGLVNGYASTTKNQVGGSINFQTFCIEFNEHVSGGVTYNAILNSNAVQGGVGPTGDPISIGTAYLYYEFAKGTLSNYDYTNPGRSGAGSSAALLQDAIWFLEGEGGANNAYVTLVAGLFGGIAGAEVDNNGVYGVAALNLYNLDGSLAQDVLILTPEPMTLILFGLGLIGLAGLRRKE